MATQPDLEDLDLLLAVSRHGSIGAAAGERGCSQAAASRRVARLERSLGVELFHRSTRGSSLTPDGQVVVDWAARLLRASEDFTRAVDTLRGAQDRALRVAVSMTIAEHHAPRWLGAMRTRHPGVEVSLSVRNSTDVVDLVERGEVDLGFVESPRTPGDLGRVRVGWDALAVAVAASHPWASRGTVGAADLATTPLLVRERGSGTRETLEHALRRHSLTLVPALELASNTALTSAAIAGMGPVVLAEVSLASETDAGRLVTVAVRDLRLRRPLTGVWRRGRPRPPAADALLAIAADTTAPRA